MIIRKYVDRDLPEIIRIWNEVVEEGIAFPQEELLDSESGVYFFSEQSYTAVAEEDGKVYGLYILHPNNVGRCGHICNASYAVSSDARGKHIGEQLVLDCLKKVKNSDFECFSSMRSLKAILMRDTCMSDWVLLSFGLFPGDFV